jgi:peptidoglycan/xylan/chitin deacetylase (PgdA/CDA1 family)
MPHVDQVYPVRSRSAFRRDLDFFLRHFEPVGAEELKSTSGKKRRKPLMFLSFDDGLSEIYDVVAPMLISRGIPAGIFVNTAFIDNRELFYRYKASLLIERLESIAYSPAVTELLQSRYHLAGQGRKYVRDFLMSVSYRNRAELDEVARLVDMDFQTFLKVRKPYMSLQHLKELAAKGFYIGAHSVDHPLFAEIGPAERMKQYRESMEYISRELQPGYRIFSFPFSGDGVPEEFFSEIRAGGMPGLDAMFGTAGLKKDPLPFLYHRIQMEAGRASASRYLRGEYLYYLAKGPAGKNTMARK